MKRAVRCELGGIFVLPEFRGYGIAKKVVSYLLENSSAFEKLYCLPFSHLSEFYMSMGFSEERTLSAVPNQVLDKHRWCNETYENRTELFSLQVHK